MNIINAVTIGEVMSSLISLVALVFAGIVAIYQVKLNKRLLITNNLVAVNAEVSSLINPGDINEDSSWELHIFNIGNSLIYLTDYTFDGKKSSNINRVLPNRSGEGYIVNLPKKEKNFDDDIPAHHIELILSDIENKRYSCSITVKFINGRWREEVTRCNKI